MHHFCHQIVDLDNKEVDELFSVPPPPSHPKAEPFPYAPTRENLLRCKLFDPLEARTHQQTPTKADDTDKHILLPPPSPQPPPSTFSSTVQPPTTDSFAPAATSSEKQTEAVLPDDETKSPSAWRLFVKEEFKFMVKLATGESKSQLIGVVRAQPNAYLPALSAEEEAQMCGTKIVIQPAAREMVVNPKLTHQELPPPQSGSKAYNITMPNITQQQDDGTVILKYKHDGLQLPAIVRTKTSLKSSATSSFVILEVALAFNNLYQPKRPVLAECKVSVKALDGLLRVVDAKGKQPSNYSFAYARETQVLTWTESSSSPNRSGVSFDKALTFLARLEVQESRDDVSSLPLSLPVIATVTFPRHLIGPSTYTLSYSVTVQDLEEEVEEEGRDREREGPDIDIKTKKIEEEKADTSFSSRLEYSFL